MTAKKTNGIYLKLVSFAAVLAILAGAAALPAFAEDGIMIDDTFAAAGSNSDSTSSSSSSTASSTVSSAASSTAAPAQTAAPSNASVYVVAETVTDANGAEIATVGWGDKVNIVLRVVDYSSAKFNVEAQDISARVNSSVFTYTGNGEISQLVDAYDSNGEYYTYVLLFRDVIYNGGGNTLPINLSYLDSNLEMQQFSVTIGQCVDEDPNDPSKATTPNLVIRESSYGNTTIVAGTPFTLRMTLYSTSGTEDLNDVIASLTLPEGVTLSGGSLSSYIGTMSPKSTREVGFPVLAATSFDKGVANVTVNLTGTGALSGTARTSQTVISVPISQPDRFELGTMELPDSLTVGNAGTITLNFVNKGKTAVSNIEGVISGSNFTSDNSDQYLGNLAAGSTNSIDFDILPEAAGSVSGIITINYEASDGTAKTLTKDFNLPVTEAMDMGMDMGMDTGMDEPAPQPGMPVWGWVLIGLGALVVVIIIVVAVRRRKKKADLDKLEADDDFDLPETVSSNNDNSKDSHNENL